MGIVYSYNGQNGGGGSGGSGAIATPYATFADFPISVPEGSLALAEDTGILYVFSSGTWIPQAASSSMYTVDLFTLSPTDITNKFVTLSATPSPANRTILQVIGGPVQDYGNDYIVSGSQLSWSSLFLDGVLTAGDKLIVQFL